MIIGFLADKIPYKERRGWGAYSYQLLKALLSLDGANTYRCYYNFFRRGRRALILRSDRPNFENVLWRIPGSAMNLIWEQLRLLSAEDILGNIDVLHVPYEYLPRVRSAKTVVTVHDVTFLKHPQLLEPSFVKLYTQRIRKITERADRVVVVSESTRLDLLEFTGVPEKRVKVILSGVDTRFKPVRDIASISAVSRHYGIGNSYVLFVGAADEDKNLIRLATAFAAVHKDHPAVQLVLVGSAHWGFDRLMAKLSSMNLTDGVVRTGYVADHDLPALYSGARLLAIPSIHEGFGLPALEAMACGTPVLCSDISSLPEIVGDAGLKVDPYSVDAIENGLRVLLEDTSLAELYAKRGLARAQRFSWEAAARQVMSLYAELER
jgi:glycosyltransferase involved in cell wall biosynthesis